MKLLVGSSNKGKFKEIKEVLGCLPIELITPDMLGTMQPPEETGSNYDENALLKAQFYYEKSGGITTVAEDSGIEINALPGELGHLTRRWGKGENATDEEWLSHFLDMMKKQKNRSAIFKCTAVLVHNGKSYMFHGECPGEILTEPQTAIPHGIPISACFLPEGAEKVYAALTPEEKNNISHRGRAMHQVKDFLKTILPTS